MKSFNLAIDKNTLETTGAAIAAGSTLGLQQQLLAEAGQPGLTVLAVGFTNTGKVQGVSLGDGNVVEVYASGTDFNSGTVLYREFMSLGEPICFTGLSNGAIITATQGFYGVSEQLNGGSESPMPLLSYGLSFTSTFFFGFRHSSALTGVTNQSYVRVVNGPLTSEVKLEFGTGGVVNGQENIKLAPWEFASLQTQGNTEYILSATNPIMACVHALVDEAGGGSSQFYDSRLIMPLTNDGITWPRSGFVSAPFNDTNVEWYVRDGSKSEPPGSLRTTRSNITGAQATLDSMLNDRDTYSTILFTTPATAPSANNIEAIWESGGGGRGASLAINESFGLSVRQGTSVGLGTANDTLTSAGALTASTQYAVVVEFFSSTNTVNLHYQAASDFSWYSIGRIPEDTASATVSNISGSGDFTLAGTGADVGGYSPPPTSYAFTGTIDSDYNLYDLNSTIMVVSPGSPVDFDRATGADDADYEPDGATRVLATGLISAYSGADSAGAEATPLMPTSAMSQVVPQPLFIADNGDGGNSGVAIASPFEGEAKVFEWNDTTKSLDLAYTVPLNRNIGGTSTREEQNHPSAGLIANDAQATNILAGQLNPGVIIADVPITVVVQNGLPTVGPANTLRSQGGTTTTGIVDDDDETLMLGVTPETISVEIREDANGILRKRVIDGSGNETWVVA